MQASLLFWECSFSAFVKFYLPEPLLVFCLNSLRIVRDSSQSILMSDHD